MGNSITVKRTYVDANVLIAAFRGEKELSRRAMQVLDDPGCQLVVSDFLRLEVMPKPTFYGRQQEIDFMQAVLNSASENVDASPQMTQQAIDLASRYDLTSVDALHAAAAVVAKVDELVTLEKAGKPIHRVQEIRVTYLGSSGV